MLEEVEAQLLVRKMATQPYDFYREIGPVKIAELGEWVLRKLVELNKEKSGYTDR